MSFQFSPFFSDSVKEVKDLADPFLKENGLNYFQYGSFYADNSATHLVTHQDFVQERANNQRRVASHIDVDLIDRDLYMFFWNESLPLYDTNLARDFDLDKGLCFVERFQDHYNLIAFASSVSENPLNFYLNNKGKLLRFISEFKDKGSDLLKKAYDNRYTLPGEFQDENKDKLILGKDFKKECVYNGLRFHLTKRELDCLRLFCFGMTLNHVGETLEISPRTVETYLNRVKSKAGILARKELFDFSQTLTF